MTKSNKYIIIFIVPTIIISLIINFLILKPYKKVSSFLNENKIHDLNITKKEQENINLDKDKTKEPASLNEIIDTTKSSIFSVLSDEEFINDINNGMKEIANTSAKLNTDINFSLGKTRSLTKADKEFLSKLYKCENYKDTSTSTINNESNSLKEVKDIDKDKCLFTEIYENKTIKCNFDKSNLSTIVAFYNKKLTGSSDNKYNIDFDMQMPKIDFKKADNNGVNLNLDMQLPKLKVNEIKTPAEKIIKDSCN